MKSVHTRLRSVVTRLCALCVVVMPTAVIAPQAYGQSSGVLLTGTITDAAGETMEGVVVSVRSEGANLTTSVYSDGDGVYVFPRMPAGLHQLRAQAVSYAAGRAEPELAGAVYRQDFVLQSIEHFEAQLPGDRWVAALPEDTAEDRRMKTVFRSMCGGCHSQNTALLTRFDEQGWLNIISVMSRIATSGYVASPMSAGLAQEDRPPSPLMDYYKERPGQGAWAWPVAHALRTTGPPHRRRDSGSDPGVRHTRARLWSAGLGKREQLD